MSDLIDVHSHVTPFQFPPAPSQEAGPRWPCMHCASPREGTLYIGEKPFRQLDDRSWGLERRVADMDRDGVAIQVLSPMPELLSYWLDPGEAAPICHHVNAHIAEMVAGAPHRFAGLGCVPMQDIAAAVTMLPKLRSEFGLCGVEIGSNINGVMLGDPRFDEFWAAVDELDLSVFIHALHPVATKSIQASPAFTAFAGFPIDVAMTAASILMAGVMERHPTLKIAFSHGGGALGSILGRLDRGWAAMDGYDARLATRPSEQARRFYYDSNVYDPAWLRHLVRSVAPGQVFVGTDYPYAIMQENPLHFIRSAGLDAAQEAALRHGAAHRFLGLEQVP